MLAYPSSFFTFLIRQTNIMGCLIMFSLSLSAVSVMLMLNGMLIEGFVVFGIDVIISWIGGYVMMQRDKRR